MPCQVIQIDRVAPEHNLIAAPGACARAEEIWDARLTTGLALSEGRWVADYVSLTDDVKAVAARLCRDGDGTGLTIISDVSPAKGVDGEGANSSGDDDRERSDVFPGQHVSHRNPETADPPDA
jgi:hypothetical protein